MRVWLCQIAKNTYYSYLKKHKKEVSLEEPGLVNISDPDDLVDARICDREDARLIRKIMHSLSDPYKEVFMWRVYAELSFKQIGQIFGKSENWACVTYHRARNKIKEKLEVY
jgi:RNA polymerase sigma-70 factor (ECF subfamily)